MKKQLSPEDQALLEQAMKGVKPLSPNKAREMPVITKPKPKIRKPEKKSLEPDQFSEHEYLDPVGSEAPLFFSKPGFASRSLRIFKKGGYAIEARLDLHGMIVEEARIVLHNFLLSCQASNLRHILVIHGKGHGLKKPILKNKVNHWLRDSQHVLAFCSAQPNDGGNGALYVYLKRG
ncbi:MAG TPA: Smr/MutS family protein, partial [Gammaproteobacteria bacterium]|nr:Smr/MutS family protein [Gammaproteobacteria bacterium]